MHATGGVCNSRRPNSPLISFRWLRFVAGRRTEWGFGPLRSSSPCRPWLTEARHALAPSPGSAIGRAPHRAAAATTCTEYCVLGLPSRQQSTWGGLLQKQSIFPKTPAVRARMPRRTDDGFTGLCCVLQLAAGSDWTASLPEATRLRHESENDTHEAGPPKSPPDTTRHSRLSGAGRRSTATTRAGWPRPTLLL